MAKLGVYNGLCPLIDHRSLLGISKGEENGIVIVTLGRNVAIKYRLSDQKQLHSWRTKEKFTAPIIYDSSHKYNVSVLNGSSIKVWNSDDDNNDDEFLDKFKKKHKFKQQIYTIFLSNNETFVVFKNGNVKRLEDALNNRKNFNFNSIIKDNENITDVIHIYFNEATFVGLLVDKDLIWMKIIDGDNECEYQRINLNRDGCDLVGYTLHKDQNHIHLLNLWSDSLLFSLTLTTPKPEEELITTMDAILCNQLVSMISLDENYIAIYGYNKDEDGALLCIYNIQFRLIQSKQTFKMFNNGAKLYCIDNNLFLCVGQNLAVIPYYLNTEQLMSLVGSHKPIHNPDADVSIVHKMIQENWGYLVKTPEINLKLKNKIDEFLEQGLPENLIIEILIGDLIRNGDLEFIRDIFNYFIDIPENVLVKLLKFLVDSGEFKDRKEPSELIDLVLSKNFNDVLLLPHIKNELNLDEIVQILDYICFVLNIDKDSMPIDNIEIENKLINWICNLLDSSYQQLLLSKEEKIGDVIKKICEITDRDINFISELKETYFILNDTVKKSKTKKPPLKNLSYSIEQVKWY